MGISKSYGKADSEASIGLATSGPSTSGLGARCIMFVEYSYGEFDSYLVSKSFALRSFSNSLLLALFLGETLSFVSTKQRRDKYKYKHFVDSMMSDLNVSGNL